MKIANYETADGLIEGIGIVTENGLIDFTRALATYQIVSGELPDDFRSILEMLEVGAFESGIFHDVMDFVSDAGLEEPLTVENGYRLLAPIARPPAIYALGRNFPAHAMEHSGTLPTEPIVFGKASTSVIGPEEPVVYKKHLTRVDPEAELAVIIGLRGSKIAEADAADYIAGYTIVNDITARDMQNGDIASAHPWFRSKGIDTFCPMGPWVVLPEEIGERVELDIEMRVNGEVRQKDNTRNLTFKIPFLISWISQYFTLYPGDLISTGTPEGMKPVVPGDIMEISIEKIGTLRNPVVAEE